MFDPFEYFVLRKRDGLLKTDFKTALESVLPLPCHSRVQNMGQKTRERCSWYRDDAQHGGALLRPRRNLGRQSEYYGLHEIGPVFGRWPATSPTTSAPTARSPPAISSRAWARPGHQGRPCRCFGA